ncbi:ABC transporter ATP-binding protein [Nocardia speluncae]|uniref:ABC transporter ATP-binding protein n=1 Tax=Nocardia speluncae TaxID=419477 RepID=A0A846XFL0_9NOCA|nr:ABC transporter ATP-binding protein [Nocardia speluncae]NKY33510.1 ABC transporter ATP-binding protein [Nocardia speluncae]
MTPTAGAVPGTTRETAALALEGLVVRARRTGQVLVDGIDLTLEPGESVGIVGESGSGKTLTVMAAAGLLPAGTQQDTGTIRLGGRDIGELGAAERRRFIAGRVGVIFQNPTASLNPRLTVATQVGEVVRAAKSKAGTGPARVRELLDLAQIPDRDRVLAAYPHELSGGLNQRVAIALALAASPSVLIADEATTALDVTTQHRVLGMLADLRRDLGLALLLVSHDMGVVADTTERVLVMRGGKIVEHGETAALLAAPGHPYTQELLDALPQRLGIATAPDTEAAEPLVTVRGVTAGFPEAGTVRRRTRTVLHSVDMELRPGCSLGIVGESGSGKTTLARIVAGLLTPTSGSLSLGGDGSWSDLDRARRAQWRRDVQYVFQDPYGSLNPRMTVAQCLREPLEANGLDRRAADARITTLIPEVGLPADVTDRRTSTLSGGQRQRVGIARALATDPRVLIGDEPVSALDVTVQAHILRLLKELVTRRGLSLLFISHDLAVVGYLCESVVVMRDGRIVESGRTADLLTDPKTEYTRRLVEAVPGSSLPGRAPTVESISS